MSGQTLKIGTRKSVMALAQTEGIARLLRASDPALDVEIVKFETRGDQDQTSKLLRHGGKVAAMTRPGVSSLPGTSYSECIAACN